MYGQHLCGHCYYQKRHFGDAFEFVNYVDCKDEESNCPTLKGFPTWVKVSCCCWY